MCHDRHDFLRNGQPEWVRYGTVTNIREVIQRREGDPAGGALAGAIIGGILGGGRGPGALFGAMGGAAVGAAASSGSSERISYEVWVRFQDGGYQAFVYAAPPPFRPGDPWCSRHTGCITREAESQPQSRDSRDWSWQ